MVVSIAFWVYMKITNSSFETNASLVFESLSNAMLHIDTFRGLTSSLLPLWLRWFAISHFRTHSLRRSTQTEQRRLLNLFIFCIYLFLPFKFCVLRKFVNSLNKLLMPIILQHFEVHKVHAVRSFISRFNQLENTLSLKSFVKTASRETCVWRQRTQAGPQ